MTTEVKNNGNGSRGNVAGVVKIVGQSQLPQEFLQIGKFYDEAVGRGVLRDDFQRNAVNKYKFQLDLFFDDNDIEVQNLTSWLNMSGSVGGFNRSLAAMTYTQVYVPEGAGIKISKENQKALMEMQKQRNMTRSRDENGENNNGNGNHGV